MQWFPCWRRRCSQLRAWIHVQKRWLKGDKERTANTDCCGEPFLWRLHSEPKVCWASQGRSCDLQLSHASFKNRINLACKDTARRERERKTKKSREAKSVGPTWRYGSRSLLAIAWNNCCQVRKNRCSSPRLPPSRSVYEARYQSSRPHSIWGEVSDIFSDILYQSSNL